MNDKQRKEFIALINDLYFRFQDNDEIKQRFKNENIYDKLVDSLKVLYDSKDYKEFTGISYNLEHLTNILNQLNTLTKNLSSISVHNVQVLQYANQLISACQELFTVKNDKRISEDEFIKRYDKLLNLLTPIGTEPRLIIEKKEVYQSGNDKNNLAITLTDRDANAGLYIYKDDLIKFSFHNASPNGPKDLFEVFKNKIIDNTIFDEIGNKSQIDFPFMPEGRINKLEEERLKTSGQIKDLEEQLKQRENDFTQLQMLLSRATTLEDDFNNAKDAVLKNIELKQATSYWETQAEKYHDTYKMYFWVNIMIAIVLIVSAFLLINKSGLFIQDLSFISDKNTTTPIDSLKILVHSVPFFNYVLFILYTTLVIWIMKIIVKIMLSNYHLAVDGNERVIMINTYLVLLEDGKGFEEEDRKVILDNIFRQTNHGIIKDETSITVADIVSSFKK